MKIIRTSFVGLFFWIFPIISADTHAAENITEMIVTVQTPGPPLWEVTNGENTLWLFGNLSPVPKGLNWDSGRVERIIEEADEFLGEPTAGAKIGLFGLFSMRGLQKLNKVRIEISGNESLEDILTEDMNLRLQAIFIDNPKYIDRLSIYKPWFAAEEMQRQMLKRHKLVNSNVITKKLNSLRRRHHILLTESEIKIEKRELTAVLEEGASLPDDYGLACFEATLDLLEHADDIEERARYWYQGELYLREFPVSQKPSACSYEQAENSALLNDKGEALLELWMSNVTRALTNNRNTFAIFPMGTGENGWDLGVVQRLRDQGFEVKEPK